MASMGAFAEGLAEGGISRRPWTRAEFERAAELGLFGPEERLDRQPEDNRLEVHRDPETDTTEPFGHRYRTLTRLWPAETLRLHATPARIEVACLLP